MCFLKSFKKEKKMETVESINQKKP